MSHSSENSWDVIILGGGAAGLLLLWELLKAPRTKSLRILLLEQQREPTYNKTWCFWTTTPEAYAKFTSASWKKLAFHGSKTSVHSELGEYTYVQVRNDDFTQHIQGLAGNSANVSVRFETVTEFSETEDWAKVHTDRDCYTARWVFSSLQKPPFVQAPTAKTLLWQHFAGVVIQTNRQVFDPSTVTLMDFRVPQPGAAAFFYVLPYKNNRALVEYTVCSGEVFAAATYDEAIAGYLAAQYGLSKEAYTILHRETGRIPMTDARFPRRLSKRVIKIGTAGGQTKPSTGYTFAFAHRDATAITTRLGASKDPAPPLPHLGRYRFYDRILLNLLAEHGAEVGDLLGALFARNRASVVLKFLAERTHLLQEVPLLLRLPWSPFLQALWRVYFRDSRSSMPVPAPVLP